MTPTRCGCCPVSPAGITRSSPASRFSTRSAVSTSAGASARRTFKKLEEREIAAYIATGCPMDKAGAYAIQGGAVHFVRSINGSYTNVIGLPMTELYEVLQ